MAAESPALLSDAVAGLSTEQRAHWKMTGELPSSSADDSSLTPPADSSPAEPAAQAAEIAATPPADSEPAPSNTKKRGNAETRKLELQAEIDALLKRRAELQREESARPAPPATPSSRDATPADSSPASDGKPPADLLRSPDISKPMLTDAEFFQTYPSAGLHEFNRYVARYEMLLDRAEQKQTASVESAQSRYRAHYEAAKAEDADLPSKLPERFLKASPVIQANAGPLNFVAREIQDSEQGPALLRYLGDHPEEFDRLEALPDAAAVIRAMARLESRVSGSTSTSPTPAKRGVSAAPEPTTSLGRRAVAPADAKLAAVADGNVRRYMDEANREALARRSSR